ncbi:MAG: STAS/SEC14 domain-containing protein [Verrucomicrobiia bacterium]
MSAEIIDRSDQTLTCRLSGKLTYAELVSVQKEAAQMIRKSGKIRILVLLEGFAGMDKVGDWGDVSFQAENDPFIEKIALVGERKWEDVALLFAAKGIRRVQIEYFPPTDLTKAKTWLAA